MHNRDIVNKLLKSARSPILRQEIEYLRHTGIDESEIDDLATRLPISIDLYERRVEGDSPSMKKDANKFLRPLRHLLIEAGFYIPAEKEVATIVLDGKRYAQAVRSFSTGAAIAKWLDLKVDGHSMSGERFWSLIELTTEHGDDQARQLESLRSVLRGLDIDDLVAFEDSFQVQLRRSYSWALWGAGHVVHGMSDDGFEDFRCWLMSRGQHVFEAVLQDPDNLADFLAPQSDPLPEFERFAGVACRVWSEKTGQHILDMGGGVTGWGRPTGRKFSEGNPAELAVRYPRLWRVFGKAWLQRREEALRCNRQILGGG